MLTKTVVIEDRVLRFVKANCSFNSGSGFGSSYNASEPSSPKEFHDVAANYPQV